MAIRKATPKDQRPPRQPSAAVVDAFQQLVSEVFRLNGQFLASAEVMARNLGISPAGWQTIAVIRDDPKTVSAIARRLGLRRQSVQHNVNLLLRQGLVELRPNPGHRRAGLVALTPAGRVVMGSLRRLQYRLAARFLERWKGGPGDPRLAGRVTAVAQALRTLRETAESAEAAGAPAARRRRGPARSTRRGS